MFTRNFGGTNKEYYGIFESGLYFSLTVVNYIYTKKIADVNEME